VASILNEEVIQNALLGDHNLYFYESSKEKHSILFSNLKAGLDRGCSALYIASGEGIEPVQVEMQNFGLKLDEPMKLKILTSHQFYTPDGEFQIDRVVDQYRSLIDESLDRSLEGLYVSADAADTFDNLSKNHMVEEWLKYEKAFGRRFKFPMEAMCSYRIDQIGPSNQALLELIKAHKNTITAKTANFVDNEKLYMDAITEELNNIFGEEAAKIIFNYIESSLKIPRNQIPNKIENFNKVLDEILGRGVTIIEHSILKNLHEKVKF